MAATKEVKLKTADDITPEIREILQDRWGDQDDETYIALERDYRTLARDNMDVLDSVAMHIRDQVKWRKLREEAIRCGDTKMITALNQSIKQAEDMIKAAREAKVVVRAKVDDMAARCEKKGLMKDGVLTLEGVIDYIKTDHGVFHMSRDACDMMMLSCINAARFNSGTSELVELPEEYEIQDKLGEFMEAPTPFEKGTMAELGYAPKPRGVKQ